LQHKPRPENLGEPFVKRGNGVHVRALLSHFADQFPFDKLKPLLAQRFLQELLVFRSGPALARWIGCQREIG
jgi:hypothetical protein